MAQKSVEYKVVRDKLSPRVGRERGKDLKDGKTIKVNKEELDIMKKNRWVTLKKEVKDGN